MITVTGILGSPRKNGNTDLLLERAMEGARSAGATTEKVVLDALRFSPCRECADIRHDGICKVNDDMQTVYPLLDRSDVIILASPIFFGSLTAQTKMMIDRFQCRWAAEHLFKTIPVTTERKGVFLCAEASDREDFFRNARAIVKNFFVTVGAEYSHELLCGGVDVRGAVLKKTECLDEAFRLGSTVVTEVSAWQKP